MPRYRETERGHLAEAMRLAERLGAEIVTLPGRSAAEEILAFARSRNATRVVLGKSQRSRWFELRHGSVVDDPVRSSSGLAIEVVSADKERVPAPSLTGCATCLRLRALPRGGTLTTALATAVGVAIDRLIVPPNISLVFVVPVMSGGGATRPGAVALGRDPGHACLQFFLPAAALRIHHPRPGQCRGAVLLHGRGRRRQRTCRPHALADRGGTARGAHHRRALRLQPQDRGRHGSLRPAVDHRHRTGAAPECGDRDADAARWPAGKPRRLPARQRLHRRRPGGGALVVGRRPSDRQGHRHPARRTLAVRAHPHRARAGRRDRRAGAEGGPRAQRRRSPHRSTPSATRPPSPSSA